MGRCQPARFPLLAVDAADVAAPAVVAVEAAGAVAVGDLDVAVAAVALFVDGNARGGVPALAIDLDVRSLDAQDALARQGGPYDLAGRVVGQPQVLGVALLDLMIVIPWALSTVPFQELSRLPLGSRRGPWGPPDGRRSRYPSR